MRIFILIICRMCHVHTLEQNQWFVHRHYPNGLYAMTNSSSEGVYIWDTESGEIGSQTQ